MSESATIIDRAYKLESLLRILTLATDGEQISGKNFEHCGGGMVLQMAADMAGEIVSALEIAENHHKQGVQ